MSAKKTATSDDILKYLKAFEKRFNAIDKRFDGVDKRFDNVDKDLHFLKTWIFSEEKRFIKQEKLLFEWKSEIHNLIDKGFTTKAKQHDEEIAILNNRTIELRNRMDKMEGVITV